MAFNMVGCDKATKGGGVGPSEEGRGERGRGKLIIMGCCLCIRLSDVNCDYCIHNNRTKFGKAC